MNKVVGVLVAIGVIAVWKLVIPTIVVSMSGWDDARPELLGKFKAAFPAEVRAQIGDAKADLVVACLTDKAIEFLNGTDCKYKYNELTTSQAEHLAAQEACMEAVGYAQKEEAFAIECMKQHVPELL